MEYRRRLLFHGMALFLIGLLTGLLEQHFSNVRMALAAHLEGVMNGTFLLAVGAIWSEVRLPPRAGVAAYWALLCGTYGNWAVTTLAAVLVMLLDDPKARQEWGAKARQRALTFSWENQYRKLIAALRHTS